MSYFALLEIPLQAILYRLRGSDLHLTTFLNRILFYTIPAILNVLLLCYLNHLAYWLVPLSGLLAFATICIGHSKYATNTIVAYIGMTVILAVRNIAIYAPLAIYAANWHYLYPCIASLLVFPLCWLSYEPFMQKKLTLFGIPLIYTIPSSEPEEMLIGANNGLMMALEVTL